MYQFKPVSERMQKMQRKIRDRIIQNDAERALITTEVVKKNEHLVPMILRPLILKTVCEKMTIRVEEYEMLVGNSAKNFCGAGLEPDWVGIGWIPEEIKAGRWTLKEDGLYHNPEDQELRLSMSPEDYQALLSIEEFWQNRTYDDLIQPWQPPGYEELARVECTPARLGKPFFRTASGHLTAGFPKIIKEGYGSIRRQAQEWLDSHTNNLMGDDAEKCMFYQGVVLSCDAASIYARRYSEKCRELAGGCTDKKRKEELISMADSLEWISENPCRTFREACQQAILYQYLLKMSHLSDSGSYGRFDQYTWPFLARDLEENRLTMDEAQEIVDCFFLKVNSSYTGSDPYFAQITGIGNTYLHTTIGGVDPKTGEDASNPVTYMVLESVGGMALHDPTISLRINKNTPKELWDLAIETSRRVGGLPLFQNDEVIIPGIIKELGFSLEDARDYAIIGCQEITGSGNEYSCANGICPPHATVHYSTLLDMAINDGRNPMNGEQGAIHTGYLFEMNSIDEVKEAWVTLARYYLKAQVSMNNFVEYFVKYHTPYPILSMSMEGCMESGVDCTAGGAKYNFYGGTATGLATVADSLTAIKYMCFDKKLCTTKELYDAVMADWEGYEPLRQRIISEVPHFGNHDPYADEMMKWVTTTYHALCGECFSSRARVYKAGLYGAADHVGQGYSTWATPDGRFSGSPIADAASPSQGRDTNGPTAVFSSSLCYDHSMFMDGVCLNVRLHPSVFSTDDGIDKLREMIKTYMKNGGAETQFNVVSTETMRAAQAQPDEYRDLVVRIAGYSAYFVELSRDCQDDLITRTENTI